VKKVTAFIGTQSRKATYLAVQKFEKNLKLHGDIDFEYVFLHEYHLEFCRGCKQCFIKGEEYCPAKDDRDMLINKIENSDGIVFATPTYSHQVSARMKNFLDRLSFIQHRPRFFQKTFTAIVAQGLPMGSNTLKYLLFNGKNLGFHVSEGCCVTTLDPITENQLKQLNQKVKKTAEKFYTELLRPAPVPSVAYLALFRLSRSGIKTMDHTFKDYQYYKEQGWFESDYYYPTTLSPLKKLSGNLFDFIGQKIVKW
jgi:multimeric flavodoxin WrbA